MIDRGTCKAMLRESARLMLEQADRLSDIDSKFGDRRPRHHHHEDRQAHGRARRGMGRGIDQGTFSTTWVWPPWPCGGGSAGPLYGTLISGLGAQLGDDENELSADARAACSPAA